MKIQELLDLDYNSCDLNELLLLIDRPSFLEVSNFFKLFNYLPLNEPKVYSENLFICHKSDEYIDDLNNTCVSYKLLYNNDILLLCQLSLGSLNIALLDKNVYSSALSYLFNSLDLNLLQTKNLDDDIMS